MMDWNNIFKRSKIFLKKKKEITIIFKGNLKRLKTRSKSLNRFIHTYTPELFKSYPRETVR